MENRRYRALLIIDWNEDNGRLTLSTHCDEKLSFHDIPKRDLMQGSLALCNNEIFIEGTDIGGCKWIIHLRIFLSVLVLLNQAARATT